MSVEVTKTVKDGIDALQHQDEVKNLADWRQVYRWLKENKHSRAATWILNNIRAYGRGLKEGFHVKGSKTGNESDSSGSGEDSE